MRNFHPDRVSLAIGSLLFLVLVFAWTRKSSTRDPVLQHKEYHNVLNSIEWDRIPPIHDDDDDDALDARLLGDNDDDDGYPEDSLLPPDLTFSHLDRLLFYQKSQNGHLVEQLVEAANHSLECGPWSVVDKPRGSWAHSNDPHDYYTPAPYFWPQLYDNGTVDADAPYVRRDGYRVPGTVMFGPMSERYDRTRLACMQHNTTVLALAYLVTGQEVYAETAARNIRTWFVHPDTRMHPHLRYAQVRTNHNANHTGSKSGIIEMKDLYFVLDAIRIVRNHLSKQERQEVHEWFRQYMEWLETSRAARIVRQMPNNQGVYYDLQILSIAAFLNDTDALLHHLNWNLHRLSRLTEADGGLNLERKRTMCEHYQLFALQGWSNLARILSSATSLDLWDLYYEAHGVASALCTAAERTIPYLRLRPPCAGNIKSVDGPRWWPLLQEARLHCPAIADATLVFNDWMNDTSHHVPNSLYYMPTLYHPDDAIAPFWNLRPKIKKQKEEHDDDDDDEHDDDDDEHDDDDDEYDEQGTKIKIRDYIRQRGGSDYALSVLTFLACVCVAALYGFARVVGRLAHFYEDRRVVNS